MDENCSHLESVVIKTISFGIMHVSIAFVVIGLLTGDWFVGGVVALVEPCINTLGYHFHEKAWAHRSPAPASIAA